MVYLKQNHQTFVLPFATLLEWRITKNLITTYLDRITGEWLWRNGPIHHGLLAQVGEVALDPRVLSSLQVPHLNSDLPFIPSVHKNVLVPGWRPDEGTCARGGNARVLAAVNAGTAVRLLDAGATGVAPLALVGTVGAGPAAVKPERHSQCLSFLYEALHAQRPLTVYY